MSENEESSGFKVVDKRRFGSDGEANETSQVVEPQKIVSGEAEESEILSDGGREQLNFSSFVLGMYTQTLIFLGDIPHPDTNEVSMNIEAAKQNIDILNILEEKTKGNLNAEEGHLMKEVLDMLRLQFISKK